jgi:hypothetical protein
LLSGFWQLICHLVNGISHFFSTSVEMDHSKPVICVDAPSVQVKKKLTMINAWFSKHPLNQDQTGNPD